MRAFLGSHGIEAIVVGEEQAGCWGIEGAAIPESLPVVSVLDKDKVKRARELISDFERNRGQDAKKDDPWRCATCGEESEARFTECWQCGAGRVEG
ncbi:MAG: DUF2007 domain-containing protein [Planctomycetes bacterium]|nr:DUF2007 domain-containing protein [Planctomycetota bacterium]